MKVIMRDEGYGLYWVGEKGLKDFVNPDEAVDMTEEEAETQINWYLKLGFALEWKGNE